MQKPMTKKLMEPVEPTAASAAEPKSLPTIMASTMLYSCWNSIPNSVGRAKPSISRMGLPVVRSLVTELSSLQEISAYYSHPPPVCLAAF